VLPVSHPGPRPAAFRFPFAEAQAALAALDDAAAECAALMACHGGGGSRPRRPHAAAHARRRRRGRRRYWRSERLDPGRPEAGALLTPLSTAQAWQALRDLVAAA
jgi:hypothetical protein